MSKCGTKASSSSSKRGSKRSKNICRGDGELETNCDESFTLSGSKPPKTVGPLCRRHDQFAKYAPCGHWSSCKKNGCEKKKYFDACTTCPSKAPYGPYGPWSKSGPAQFISPKQNYLRKVFAPPKYPKCNGLQQKKQQPMGKMRPWPLSGSCRYGGRPYGPCRPFGAYRSRGPFGAWTCKSWPESCRPMTPCQPCWMPKKAGLRPCTPCHRPLFRPCKPCLDEH